MKSSVFGAELDKLYPVIEEGGSDSAAFDNVLELLVINGVLSLPEAVMLMVPEAWQDNPDMNPKKAAFYEWAACLMEPWDGPALFTFADGRYCGANLDRNGLRPCRYYVTDDDRIICASEVGTIVIPSEKIVKKGRLQPGRMLLVDTVEGRIVDDRELKAQVSARFDFQQWVDEELITMDKITEKLKSSDVQIAPVIDEERLINDRRLLAFGYSYEQVTLLLGPMVSFPSFPISFAETDSHERLPTRKKPLVRWATTHRWRVWLNSRECCTNTSGNFSPKSPILPSTPFVRQLSCLWIAMSARKEICSRWILSSATVCFSLPQFYHWRNSI